MKMSHNEREWKKFATTWYPTVNTKNKNNKMENLTIAEAVALAKQTSKETKGTIFSVVEQKDGAFAVTEGVADPFHSSYRGGKKFDTSMSEVAEKVAPAKKAAPAKKKAKPAKVAKKATGKVPAKKSANTVPGITMPMKWILELVEEKKTVTKDVIRRKLEKEYAPATVSAQMSRVNKCPNFKVDEENVKFVK